MGGQRNRPEGGGGQGGAREGKLLSPRFVQSDPPKALLHADRTEGTRWLSALAHRACGSGQCNRVEEVSPVRTGGQCPVIGLSFRLQPNGVEVPPGSREEPVGVAEDGQDREPSGVITAQVGEFVEETSAQQG